MSGPAKVDQKPVTEAEDVGDDIPMYCILGQELDTLYATQGDQEKNILVS